MCLSLGRASIAHKYYEFAGITNLLGLRICEYHHTNLQIIQIVRIRKIRMISELVWWYSHIRNPKCFLFVKRIFREMSIFHRFV